MVSKEIFDSTVRLLLPHMRTIDERKAFIGSALLNNCQIVDGIVWEGSATDFTRSLLKQLIELGNQSAIVMLLKELRSHVGHNDQTQIDKLINVYSSEQRKSSHSNNFSHTYSIEERYNSLPSDEDREHFRALGVLPRDLAFDARILSYLWGASSRKTDVSASILREFELLVSPERDLYYQTLDMRSKASILIYQEPSESDRIIRNYANGCYSLVLGFDESSIHHKWYSMYFNHISEVVNHAIGAMTEWDGNRDFGVTYLPKFAKVLYPLGRTWYGLKNWQNAIDVFRGYDAIASTLVGTEDRFYDPVRHGSVFFEMSDSYAQLSDFRNAIHYLQEYITHLESIDVQDKLESVGYFSMDKARDRLLFLLKKT